MSKPNDFPPQDETFVSHLVELRDRLLRAVVAVLIVFLCLFSFANDLYTFLAEPLMRNLPAGSGMIATGVITPFLTPFKLALVASIFVAMPFILYQAWAFIAPGLYQTERRLVLPLVISSAFLFYLGMVFAYYVVFPLVFGFMATTTPAGVTQAPDISIYLDFAIKLFFAFGVAFEVPIATILVIWAGITTRESLAAKRPYIIVAAFVVGMLLTPPDVISQTLLALPMWLLFELGLVMSKMYTKKPQEEDQEAEHEVEPEAGDSPGAHTAANAAAADADAQAVAVEEPPATAVAEDEEYRPLSEAEMDAELDRLDEQEQTAGTEDHPDDDHDGEPHPEFEPISEEEARRLDNPQDDENPDKDKPIKE